MRVWVSGSAGLLGREVVRLLHDRGDEVVQADVAGTDPVDLTDPTAVEASMREVEAIVHCAGIPSPEAVAPDRLVWVNTMTTFVALERAWLAGVRTAVLASSGSIYGTAWSPSPTRFAAVPVDEDTPLEYVDPYALSKDLLERIGGMYARRGMSVTALRFHWILDREQARAEVDREEAERARNLWGYVDLTDAARACLLCLDAREVGPHLRTLLIASDETLSTRPIESLLGMYLPGAELRSPLTGSQGAFDCTRAAHLIGWRPAASWRRS